MWLMKFLKLVSNRFDVREKVLSGACEKHLEQFMRMLGKISSSRRTWLPNPRRKPDVVRTYCTELWSSATISNANDVQVLLQSGVFPSYCSNDDTFRKDTNIIAVYEVAKLHSIKKRFWSHLNARPSITPSMANLAFNDFPENPSRRLKWKWWSPINGRFASFTWYMSFTWRMLIA